MSIPYTEPPPERYPTRVHPWLATSGQAAGHIPDVDWAASSRDSRPCFELGPRRLRVARRCAVRSSREIRPAEAGADEATMTLLLAAEPPVVVTYVTLLRVPAGCITFTGGRAGSSSTSASSSSVVAVGRRPVRSRAPASRRLAPTLTGGTCSRPRFASGALGFLVDRVDGWADERRPRRPAALPTCIEDVVVRTLESTPRGATHWTRAPWPRPRLEQCDHQSDLASLRIAATPDRDVQIVARRIAGDGGRDPREHRPLRAPDARVPRRTSRSAARSAAARRSP